MVGLIFWMASCFPHCTCGEDQGQSSNGWIPGWPQIWILKKPAFLAMLSLLALFVCISWGSFTSGVIFWALDSFQVGCFLVRDPLRGWRDIYILTPLDNLTPKLCSQQVILRRDIDEDVVYILSNDFDLWAFRVSWWGPCHINGDYL